MKPSARIPFLPILLICAIGHVQLAAQTEEPDYEKAGVVDATRFLPAGVFQRKTHRMGSRAMNDGLRNTYYIVGGGKLSEVTGSEAVLERLRELDAIDQLHGVSNTETLGVALKDAVEDRAKSVGKVVSNPVDAVKNAPKGASRWFGRVRDSIRNGANRDEQEGSIVGSIIGTAKKKREFAARLDVDVYSPNEELQSELDRVARAAAAGSFGIDVGTAAVGGAAGAVLTGININNTLQQTLNSATPDELEAANRKALLELGGNEELVAELLAHPWYSPRHVAIMVDALKQVGLNPDIFLERAVQAPTTEDAFFFQRSAELLANYSKNAGPIAMFKADQQLVCGLDAKGTLAVAVPLDYLIWSERVAKRVEDVAARISKDGEIKAVEIWTDGQFSDRTTAELSKRGIGYRSLAIKPRP